MRPNIIQLIHAGHQGIKKCKRRARDCCYWPNMNQQIESVVKKCTACARSAPSKSADTLKPHPVPTQPRQKIGTDLFQTNRRNYIVVMDYYSLWPEVYQLHRITSTDVITVMKNIFSLSSHNLKPTISPIKRVGQSRSQNDQSHDKETSRNQERHHRRIADHPKHTSPMWIQPSPTPNGKETERQSSVYASIKHCYTKT